MRDKNGYIKNVAATCKRASDYSTYVRVGLLTEYVPDIGDVYAFKQYCRVLKDLEQIENAFADLLPRLDLLRGGRNV